ncbi:iron-sulfur cluster assembly protein [Baekduia sp.]|jgi:metal-sulfur cluster biosynthetic enzyme|uniref:iron-sulfur cluster assembly protein n=1 Tax=Baekduia sp. TaxID=2600305 RepID=UPI002DFE8245|nr:iron-sulfur cluster assembly protein [Baekduia sp.]
MGVGRAQVVAALSAVYDPELDEPITTLGFVDSLSVSGRGDVDVHLRLPTPQCAPNFAFLMVSDARAAVGALPGVGEVSVVLGDHYTGPEINAAVGDGGDFAAAFPGETVGDLDALRALFQRKALLARQGRVCAALLEGGAAPDGGLSAEAVVALRVVDLDGLGLPADIAREAARCLVLRRALGLPVAADAPALIAGGGSALDAADLPLWLRRARLVSLSLESNGGICRSLLRVRHGVPDPTQETALA